MKKLIYLLCNLVMWSVTAEVTQHELDPNEVLQNQPQYSKCEVRTEKPSNLQRRETYFEIAPEVTQLFSLNSFLKEEAKTISVSPEEKVKGITKKDKMVEFLDKKLNDPLYWTNISKHLYTYEKKLADQSKIRVDALKKELGSLHAQLNALMKKTPLTNPESYKDMFSSLRSRHDAFPEHIENVQDLNFIDNRYKEISKTLSPETFEYHAVRMPYDDPFSDEYRMLPSLVKMTDELEKENKELESKRKALEAQLRALTPLDEDEADKIVEELGVIRSYKDYNENRIKLIRNPFYYEKAKKASFSDHPDVQAFRKKYAHVFETKKKAEAIFKDMPRVLSELRTAYAMSGQPYPSESVFSLMLKHIESIPLAFTLEIQSNNDEDFEVTAVGTGSGKRRQGNRTLFHVKGTPQKPDDTRRTLKTTLEGEEFDIVSPNRFLLCTKP